MHILRQCGLPRARFHLFVWIRKDGSVIDSLNTFRISLN